MSSILTYGISCPLDWIPLPVEPEDDVLGWATGAAKGIVDRGRAAGYELDQEAVRSDLRARAADSREREPFFAFALYPDGFDAALGILELDLIRSDASVPEITLDWLTETFSVDDFGAPQVLRTELTVGPAVRIRQNFAARADTAGQPGVLLETVTYGVLPTGTESALVLLVSWAVPGIGDEMEEAADSIVKTLAVES
ncbi:hypothetical protein O3Q52_11655 [Streptomyces sp. ActVer]|uniref:hypothetical protein n=1 Tax=Streptomyces sp. ActVer TaxID=3014558 RepID=UPI0022B40AFC|nr:hypothetical protein [Streptomyces sp. ActVer]MCZ4508847.1 hypothetical protein [Streptomyces sp. ActVer]